MLGRSECCGCHGPYETLGVLKSHPAGAGVGTGWGFHE